MAVGVLRYYSTPTYEAAELIPCMELQLNPGHYSRC